MMKMVYLFENVVREIIPQEATEPSVAYWYGEAFAAQCAEAPDEVRPGWIYDAEAQAFSEPPEPEPIEEDPPGGDLAALKTRLDELEAAQDAMMEGLI